MMAARQPAAVQPDTTEAFARMATAPFGAFGLHPIDADVFDVLTEPPIGALRRARRRRGEGEPVAYISLIETGGVLRWELGPGPAPSRRLGPRRGAGVQAGGAGEVVRQFKFADLPPNAVGAKLRQLDDYLTPNQGLREVLRGGYRTGREVRPVSEGRILLFVHGTFTTGDHLLKEIASTVAGKALLDLALQGARYEQVLAFNHPTLSAGPILNAAALAQLFRGSNASVDVISHSRGGLVARWWLEVLDHRTTPRGRVVFAGPPLAGTGLAAPARLRAALNLLTNISRALGSAASTSGAVFPAAAAIGQAAGILFGFFGKLTAVAATNPVVDAGIAMIPGLAGQSREGANGEILRLRESFAGLDAAERRRRYLDNYYLVTSNFEPPDPRWKFWECFRKDRLIHSACDLVFDGENDLVVDTSSMASFADGIGPESIGRERIQDFGSSDRVHHLNYFQQPETIQLIRGALGI